MAFSGHKLYAPFGAGVLVGPAAAFAEGDPFLAGGGAVDLVDLDEVWWTEPPEREEAGSPNVMGAVALEAALDELGRIGWDTIAAHEHALARRLRRGLAAIDGVRVLGPSLDTDTLAIAAFVVEGVRPRAGGGPAERRMGHRGAPRLLLRPPLPRPAPGAVARRRRRPTGSRCWAGDHRFMPGAVRASCGISSTEADVDALLDAVARIATEAQRGTDAAGPLRPGPRHRRLLARERRAGVAGPRARDRRLVRAG